MLQLLVEQSMTHEFPCSWFMAGDLPDVIKQLTLAEHILIQLAFPRAYLVKLQPKKRTSMPLDKLYDGISRSVFGQDAN